MQEITYRIYADESVSNGKYFSNFYGGALIRTTDIPEIEKALDDKKKELNLNGEIKWTKVTENYLEKYIEIINLFFSFIKAGKIKVRIMFAQNAYVSDGLTKKQTDNEYSILYYYFLKDAFGIKYSNSTPFKTKVNFSLYLDDLPCAKEQKEIFKKSLFRNNFGFKQNNVEITEFIEIDSKKHVIQQCMDIILGSMNFKLNDFDKIKDETTGRRSKRTRAKEKLYKIINKNIREIRKNFNVGITTGINGDQFNYWKHPYRHWNFISSYSHFDETLTKRGTKKKNKK